MTTTVIILGFRSGKPDAVSPCSGYLLEHDGTRILVDCGPGINGSLIARNITTAIDAIVITHLHQDHSLDIVPLAHNRLLPHASAPQIPLYVPEKALGKLRELDDWLEVPTDPDVRHPLATAFDFRTMPGDGTTRIDLPGGIGLTTFAVHHAVPSTALRFATPDGTVTFSSDTSICDEVVDAARDVDLLLCEGTYPRKDPKMLAEHGHMTADQTGLVAQRAGAQHLVVTHLMGEDDSESLLLARDAAPDVERVGVAQVGLEIPVGKGE
jgi:ribonuclease BN (tRNA processing enzyme)